MCFGVTLEGDGGISLVGYFQDVAYFFCFYQPYSPLAANLSECFSKLICFIYTFIKKYLPQSSEYSCSLKSVGYICSC